ncbi:MAG TPA: CHAT domain-containing protein [Trichormus sp.]
MNKWKFDIKTSPCLMAVPPVKSLGVAIALSAALLSGATYSIAVAAGDAEAHYQSIQQRLDTALKKHNGVDEADAIYDMAVSHYNNRDYATAETYIHQSIDAEDKLHRHAQAVQAREILANILHAANRDNEAIAAYNNALTLAQSEGLKDRIVDILLCLGQLSLNLNKVDDAQKDFAGALDAATSGNLPAYQARALSSLAVAAKLSNHNADAIKYLERATALLTQWEDTGTSFGGILMQLGTAYADAGMHEKATETYLKASKTAEDDGESDLATQALSRAGGSLLSEQRPQEAIKLLEQADERFGTKQLPEHVDCLVNWGSAQADLGMFKEAVAHHQAALAMARAIHDSSKELMALNELAYDDLLQGHQEKALDGFLKAYSFLTKNMPNELANKASLLEFISMCFDGLGQTQTSVRYAQQAADIFELLGRTTDQALAYNRIAVAYLNAGAVDQFKKTADKEKSLLTSIQTKTVKDQLALAYLDYNIAQAALFQSSSSDVIQSFETALKICQDAHDVKGQMLVLCGLGLAQLQANAPDKAIDCYQQASTLADQRGDVETKWNCAVGLGIAYRREGKLKDAEEQLRKAVQLVERERRQLSRDTFKTFSLDWRADCFFELTDLLASQGRNAEALEIAEKGRARAFLDLLEGRRLQPLPGETIALLSPGADPHASRPVLAPAKTNATGTSTTRDVQIVPKAQSYTDVSSITTVNAKAPTADELLSLAKQNGSTFVEYYVLPDKILIFVISADGKVLMPPAVPISKKALGDKVNETYNLIASPPNSMKEMATADPARQAHLRDLYKLLWAPVESMLPQSPDAVITIVPHGSLFMVPFAALMTAKNEFVAEHHSLAFLPAIGVLRVTAKLESDVGGASTKLLAFGNPITKETAFLGSLPYAEKEVQSVAALFTTGATTVETGGKATKSEFRKLAPQNSIIHLATHGLIDEEHPMDSAVVLAPEVNDDGLLTVRDILQLPQLHARLVVLSACQTGRGKITGDGVVGLSRAFIIAGTPSILVSQWNVDDVMTEYQMKALYSSYLKGSSKAKSLRDAQLKTMTYMEKILPSEPVGGEKIRANPRYWAAFELIGDYQ